MSDLPPSGPRVLPVAVGLDWPRPPAWITDAACARVEPEAFFPRQGDAEDPGLTALALATCRRCGVREACLAYAVEHRIGYGIWGGETAHARKRRDRQARRAAA